MVEQLAKLKAELKTAIAAHYKQLKDSFNDVYGYAVYTDDGVSSISAVANRTSAISADPSDRMYNYYRYGAVEWSEQDDFGLFDAVNDIVGQIQDIDSVEFADKRNAMLRAAMEVMCELDAEGVFGPKSDERFVAVCVTDSDEPIMLESVERLNTPAVFEAYRSEFG
ncbi:DUF4303 domain-containing protein [Aporhodopirellula aestuarii]|uniref:DUF4303 domain-containing protein n=1 Tax=Aporhodopirellula aestuarii TaxID=2950107 RepID=A0ABT0TY08_9BACT|nr:DUF4303 domain-containing protein [Aporhodopirellula aestuarii]MCM2369478.1 DUF4303 domain-containing protein [Aporhodopirellula aestuarii]